MIDQPTVEFNNRAKILICSKGFEEYIGFCVDEVFIPDHYFVDLPPECVKLIDENLSDLLL